MASKAFLARTKLTTLVPEKLNALILQSDTEDSGALLQSHYHVEGSLEEHLGVVRTAFRAWSRGNDNYEYRWCYVLGVEADRVIFYTNDYVTDSYTYASIPYTMDKGVVTFGDTVTAVDAKIVISELGLATDATGDEVVQATMNEKETQKQDAVVNTSTVVDAALAAGGGSSAENPSVPNPGLTDADEPSTELGAPNDVVGEEGGKHGNAHLAGTGKSVVGDPGIDGAKASVEVGLKQDAPIAHTQENLLQSASVDQARKLSLGCVTQSEDQDVDGEKRLVLSCIATRAGIINSQGQVYPKKVWQAQIPKMNELAQAGKFTGKVEHEGDGGLQTVALRWLPEFAMQGDDVVGKCVVLNTIPDGVNLREQVEAGVQIDFSTVGYGSSKQEKYLGQTVRMIQDDFECVRIDAVKNGSSFGSTTTATEYQAQSAPAVSDTAMNPNETLSPEQKVQALAATNTLVTAKSQLMIQAAEKLSDKGLAALKQALDKATDPATLIAAYDNGIEFLQSVFAKPAPEELKQSAVTHTPHFYVKQTQEELAPKTVGELIDRMVQGVPTSYPGVAVVPGNENNPLHSPRAAMKQIMAQTARTKSGGFDGGVAAMSLLALEQGRTEYAQDILNQSLATGAVTAGSTNADPGGAPVSTPLIFPLIRRVYPMYIMNHIASIQPMDRPDGKIFFLDNYRVVDGTNDANALPGSSTTTTHDPRQDVNTSANPFSSSFANNNTEGSTAALLRMTMQSIAVRATNKKLGAQWSIEEMQDLRAYHNLDVQQELMGSLAREMAIEWNMVVLNDMLAGATGGARTFGTTIPAAGFTQDAWDNYIWTYIQALENDVFKKRNGGITHLVVGSDAALALGKGLRFSVDVNSDQSNLDLYPGTQFFPMLQTPSGLRIQIIKTNLWTGANASKILAIRRGDLWYDTPYVFCPYADYVTPQFTNPTDFSQQQGIMSRCATKIVVGDAMAVLTVNNSTGVPLG